LIDFTAKQDVSVLIPLMLIGGSVDRFGVDGHLVAMYPESDERYRLITQPSRDYWLDFLQKDRDDQPRGFLELQFV
jgi:hypothetical protein